MARTSRSSRFRRWAAVLAVTSIVAAACGGDDDDAADGTTASADGSADAATGAGSADAGGAGDPITVAQVAEPAGLDPAVVTAVNDFRINVNIYDGLVRYADGSLDIEPALATDWTISDDGTVYTFNLRDGVTFHDGTPFDAEAVKFNFDRMLDEDGPYADTGPFPLAQQFYGSVTEVNVVDDLTVEFVLDAAFAPFLSNLAYPTGLIVSPAAVEKYGTDFVRNPVGTGPFVFDEWVSNEYVTVTANPDYWDGAPATEAVAFVPVTEASSRVSGLQAGEYDVILELPPDQIASLREDDAYQVVEQAGPHVWFLILNAKEPPFDDVRMRQAINYAIDKETIVNDILQGTASVADGPIAAAFGSAYDDALEGYPYDPDKARELMDEAGYGDGVDVTFYVTTGGSGMLEPVAMGEVIQANLADVGINAEIQTFEWNTYLNEVNAGIEGKADMAEMAWMTNDPDTLPYLTLRTGAWPDEGGFNSGYYSNPEVDELLEAARVETDPEARADLYHQMQEIVVQDAPWVFVGSWVQNAAVSADIEGFELQPSFLLELKDVGRS